MTGNAHQLASAPLRMVALARECDLLAARLRAHHFRRLTLHRLDLEIAPSNDLLELGVLDLELAQALAVFSAVIIISLKDRTTPLKEP